MCQRLGNRGKFSQSIYCHLYCHITITMLGALDCAKDHHGFTHY